MEVEQGCTNEPTGCSDQDGGNKFKEEVATKMREQTDAPMEKLLLGGGGGGGCGASQTKK